VRAPPVIVVTLAIVLARVAAAEPAPISIEYVAPAECPDEISLKAGVIARLGHDPFDGDAARRAMIDVRPTGAGYVAAIEVREPGRAVARRAVGPARRCEDAVEALELALAVIVDPTIGDSPPTPSPVPSPPPPSPPPPQPQRYDMPDWRPPPPVVEGPRRHEIAIVIGAIAGAGPDNAGYFGVRAGFAIGARWRIGVVGRIADASGDLDAERSMNGRVSELAAEGCVRYRYVIACGIAGVGSKSVRIYRTGGETVADYSDPFGLIGVDAALEIPLGNAFLRPLVEGAIPLPNVAIESEGVRRVDLPFARLAFDLALGYRW
jgi:hypothetical protein